MPPWEYGGNKAGKGRVKNCAFVSVCSPAPVVAGLCKAVVAVAWQSKAEGWCFGVTEPLQRAVEASVGTCPSLGCAVPAASTGFSVPASGAGLVWFGW